MIAYIKGQLVSIDAEQAIVDVQGIGYKLYIPSSYNLHLVSSDTSQIFFTSHIIREGFEGLYGFQTKGERDLFEKLIVVSGIGPKTALALISSLTLEEFQQALDSGNITKICKVPGIGKKTAERLLIDLRDKIDFSDFIHHSLKTSHHSHKHLITDAMQALMNLGFNTMTAKEAIQRVLDEQKDKTLHLSELISLALKQQAPKTL